MIVWTPERYAELERLLIEGLSNAQISRKWNVSRNVVAGGVFRLRRGGGSGKPRKKPGPEKGRSKPSFGWAAVACTAPFQPDCSVPDFANDDEHVAAVMAAGGYPVLQLRRAG